MLIVENQEISAVTGGESVESTGMMQKSSPVVEVEKQLGIDLQNELYADFEGENYIMASQGRAGG